MTKGHTRRRSSNRTLRLYPTTTSAKSPKSSTTSLRFVRTWRCVALGDGFPEWVACCQELPRTDPTTSGWRGRDATATSERRCSRFPPSRLPTASPPVPASPHDWLAERRVALAEGLRRLAAAARAGASAGGSIEDGAADLVADLYRRRPDARITDLLLEVDDATRFTEAFPHLRTGSPCRDRIGLLNVLLAEGINLGLRKMAEATTTHGFWELMRIARWHVEGDAFDRALAIVVEAQAALPMAVFWGTGRTASSDGKFFPSAGRGEALNLVNARYRDEPRASRRTRASPAGSPRSPPRPSRPPSTKRPTSSTGS